MSIEEQHQFASHTLLVSAVLLVQQTSVGQLNFWLIMRRDFRLDDILANKLGNWMGGGGQSSHTGGPMISTAEALTHLRNMGVPDGMQHKIAMRYGHTGSDTEGETDAAMLTFTIDSGYTGFSGVDVNQYEQTGNYDISFCT
mgnify:CR=1 FL=1